MGLSVGSTYAKEIIHSFLVAENPFPPFMWFFKKFPLVMDSFFAEFFIVPWAQSVPGFQCKIQPPADAIQEWCHDNKGKIGRTKSSGPSEPCKVLLQPKVGVGRDLVKAKTEASPSSSPGSSISGASQLHIPISGMNPFSSHLAINRLSPECGQISSIYLSRSLVWSHSSSKAFSAFT